MDKSIEAMGKKPILPLLLSMSFPPMLSMLIQSMYNIIDSIFVARLGEDALTAVSLAFPLQNLVLSVAVGLGVGLNAVIARNLGAGDVKEAENAAAHGMVLTAVHSVMFVLIGLFLTKPFFHMFTKNDAVFTMGCQYTYLVICFSAGSLFHIAVEKMFQSAGSMVIPMLMQGFGAIVNIILDPIMIFGLLGFPAMGVTGAAAATLIGQFSACILSVLLFLKKGKIKLRLRGFRFRKNTVRNIYSVAVPSAVMSSLPSILVGTLNGILASVSQTAVAVLGIYFKLQTFVYMPANGVVQGLRPIISYNYGAGDQRRLTATIKTACCVIAGIMCAGMVLFIGFPEQIMRMFDAGKMMEEMGILALRIISMGFLVSALGITFSGTFEALGLGFHSLVISLLRQFIITIPLSVLLIRSAGVTGVWISFPVAEAIAAVAAVILFLYVWRKKIMPFLYAQGKEEKGDMK